MGIFETAKAKALSIINPPVEMDEVDALVAQSVYEKADLTKVKGALGFLKQDVLTYQEADDKAVNLIKEAESKAATLELAKAIMRRKERIETATVEAEKAQAEAKVYIASVDATIDTILGYYSFVTPGMNVDDAMLEVELDNNVGVVPTYTPNSSTAKVDAAKVKAQVKAQADAKAKTPTAATQVTNTTGLPPAAPGSVSTVPNI